MIAKIKVKNSMDTSAKTNPLIRYMQDSMASNAIFTRMDEIKKEEILEAIKKMEGENLNPVVEYAEVICTEMEGKGPVLARSNSLIVDVRNGAAGLTIDDVFLEPGSFGYCKAMKKECKPKFLMDRWENGDRRNLVNGCPALTMGSYLICVEGNGKITPYTDGQLIHRDNIFASTEEEILAHFNYDWLKKVIGDEQVTDSFLEKIIAISEDLEINPDDLMGVMAFESGFNPQIKNGNATGLIQFLPSTAESVGTTVEGLEKMTAIEQLDYVYKYYSPYKGKLKDIYDVYMVTLWPEAVGKENDYVLYREGDDSYNANKGLDNNMDGCVTKSEATQKVIKRRELYQRN